jgi:hypothetical protein
LQAASCWACASNQSEQIVMIPSLQSAGNPSIHLLLTSTSFAQYYSYGGYRPSYGYSSSYQPSYGYSRYGYSSYSYQPSYGYSRYGYGRRW